MQVRSMKENFETTWKRAIGQSLGLVLGIIFTLTGCAGKGAVKLDSDALYYRLGARKELGKVVTDTVDSWSTDPRILSNVAIQEKLKGADTNAIKRHMFSFFCWATEGPCTVQNDDFQTSVRTLNISNLEWFYLMEGFVTSMAKHSVPLREQNEILEIVYGLQPKVVSK